MIKILLSILFSYLIGSISNSILISKLFFKQDVRDLGSGNAGATNMLRNYGISAGSIAFVLDLLKGVLAVFLIYLLVDKFHQNSYKWFFAGIAVVFGHCYPLYFGFKGGKGVATALGTMLVISPGTALCAALVFVLVLFTTKYVSLASIIATWSTVLFILAFRPGFIPILYCILLSYFITVRHRENVIRLRHKQEPKIKIKF